MAGRTGCGQKRPTLQPFVSIYAGDVVDAEPPGIETFGNDEERCMPVQVNTACKEILIHTTGDLILFLSMLLKAAMMKPSSIQKNICLFCSV